MRFPRLQTLRAQALLILAVLIALVALGASRVVSHDLAIAAANSEADTDRQIQLDAASLLTGMLNEETGVRGFVNTADRQFLEPFDTGRAQVAQAENVLGTEVDPGMRPQLIRVEHSVDAWQTWATARVAAVAAKGTPSIDNVQSAIGKQLFDTFRSDAQVLNAQIGADFAAAKAQARAQSRGVVATTAATSVLVIAVLLLLALIVYRSALRPLAALFRAASSLAVGKLTEIPPMRSDNEVGRLGRALASWKRTELERLTLVKTANELSSRVELQEILDLGSEGLRRVLDCPHVTISVADRIGLHIVLSPEMRTEEPVLTMPSATPSAQAFSTRQAVIGDLRSPGWDDIVVRFREENPVGPVLAVPLVSGGDLVGVVSCVRRSDQPSFTNMDRDRAELFVPSLASAIRVSRLFENLKEAGANLELANRHKSVFLANMSHELRTPLNAILGFTQLLIDDRSGRIEPKKRLRFLEQVNTAGQHLLGLINDILDLSKVEAGQMDLHLAITSVAEAVDAVLTTVEPLAAKKQMRLVSHVTGELQLMADSGKLKQMLLNLVSNGIKFTPSGGEITISARQDGSFVEVVVSDTGVGMSDLGLKSIFQEFTQLDQGPGRQQEGTGLGLALTRRFAELHGGSISAVSSEGKGSTFTLRLPLEPPTKPVEQGPELRPVGHGEPSRPLVLVVEDNTQAAELLATHLYGGGFRTEFARNGTEALLKARDLKPVAITLDILLPEIDGWEVLTRLKQTPETRDIPVVVVSIVDNPALGRALGALDYLLKPVDRDALLSRLDRLIFISRVPHQEIRILLVDDEPANLQLLEAVLQPAGFTTVRASGGREGIELARTTQPQLILLDLMMPEVTGFDVVEALRSEESTRSIPIMVLTAKQLTDEDKKQLNGHVAAVLERNSLAGQELVSWLRQLVGV
jgi:signal transduction histidine kinase/CheY-like chemotaxis protein/CHASE3 domain sensor protein